MSRPDIASLNAFNVTTDEFRDDAQILTTWDGYTRHRDTFIIAHGLFEHPTDASPMYFHLTSGPHVGKRIMYYTPQGQQNYTDTRTERFIMLESKDPRRTHEPRELPVLVALLTFDSSSSRSVMIEYETTEHYNSATPVQQGDGSIYWEPD